MITSLCVDPETPRGIGVLDCQGIGQAHPVHVAPFQMKTLSHLWNQLRLRHLHHLELRHLQHTLRLHVPHLFPRLRTDRLLLVTRHHLHLLLTMEGGTLREPGVPGTAQFLRIASGAGITTRTVRIGLPRESIVTIQLLAPPTSTLECPNQLIGRPTA